MSVSWLVCTLPIVVDKLAQKLVWISKPNFTPSFGPLRLRADMILVHIDPKLRGEGGGGKMPGFSVAYFIVSFIIII